jgi:hypothetical protein
VVLSSDSGSSGSDPKSNSYAESEWKPERGLESEVWTKAVSESELYSGMGSLPARHEEGASVRALLRLRGPHVECSRGGDTTCDGWADGSHAMAHGDVEFELEADPSSKSA